MLHFLMGSIASSEPSSQEYWVFSLFWYSFGIVRNSNTARIVKGGAVVGYEGSELAGEEAREGMYLHNQLCWGVS